MFRSIAKSEFFKFNDVHFYKHDFQHKQFAFIEQKGFCLLIRGNYTHGENALQELLQRLPEEETLLIYSFWEGYLKEGENQMSSYVEIWNMFANKRQLHTSGHASAECLADVCQLVNPTTGIIPIHSDCSDDFKNLPISDALKEKVTTASVVSIADNVAL